MRFSWPLDPRRRALARKRRARRVSSFLGPSRRHSARPTTPRPRPNPHPHPHQRPRQRRAALHRAIAGGLSAILLSGLIVVLIAPSFSIGGAEIRGNLRVPAAAIYSASGLAGRSVFLADTAEAADAIERIPDVAAARVEIRLPHHVLITVVETEPRLLWHVGQTMLAIDETGRAIIPPATSPAKDLPTVVDVSPAPLALGQSIPAGVLEAGQAYGAQFGALSWDGEGFSSVAEPGWHVRLGADASLLSRQRMLLDGLVARSGGSGADIALVDLRFPNRPYARADAGAGSQR